MIHNLFLGGKLRAMRKACGLTQRTISICTDTDQMHISGYETNYARISLPKLVNYITLCNITFSDLINENYQNAKLNVNYHKIIHDDLHKRKLGYALTEARFASELTKFQVSLFLDVEQDTISRYENGDNTPGVLNLIKLCRIYRVNIDDILSYYIENKVCINNSIYEKIIEIVKNNQKLTKRDLKLKINQFLLDEWNYYKNPVQKLLDIQPELDEIIKEIETQI